jgi:hypothetical protein
MTPSKRWTLALGLLLALLGAALLYRVVPRSKPQPPYAEWRRISSMPVPARESGTAVGER